MNWKKFLKTKGPRVLALVIVAAIIVGAVVGALGGKAGFLTNLVESKCWLFRLKILTSIGDGNE